MGGARPVTRARWDAPRRAAGWADAFASRGIPALVDLAAMREAVKTLGGDPGNVHPACPADLTVDHSLQIDFSKWYFARKRKLARWDAGRGPRQPPTPFRLRGREARGGPSPRVGASGGWGRAERPIFPPNADFSLRPETVLRNQEIEFGRNRERLQFFKWSSRAFKGVAVVPPGAGMAHQVNLEFLSRVVFEEKDLLFPDSVLGTDSHITMANGLGILGWGVGGIETEAVMLGLPVSLTLPEVVGCELTGLPSPFVTSIDVVLGITKHLRQAGVAGKFVEFFGSGVSQLSVVDRTTIANMCPEYGATLSFFPVDDVTLRHLEHTGVDRARLRSMETYLRAVKLFRTGQRDSAEPEYSEVRGHAKSLASHCPVRASGASWARSAAGRGLSAAGSPHSPGSSFPGNSVSGRLLAHWPQVQGW
ncbi:PREDICTED: iron-responsive element-binding protein 2 [Condylura cristata]|uniref:iron-responsive element-binding protein 2 n=1 Tax=Condylura cristata TaxID=143302 RepID=UPI000643C5C9|nr:PREDICTED: iron-responsive element-binding protein 2 [Condylura cristata]